jgi:ATP-dependent DNA ligase
MFRYPDKPAATIARAGLEQVEPGYIAELKYDGWRTVIERHGSGLTFTSRHKRAIPISKALAAELADKLRHLPAGTLLDAEWVCRRPSCREEAIYIFDIMQHGEEQLWGRTAIDRLRTLEILVPHSDLTVAWSVPAPGPIQPWTLAYHDFFDLFKGRPDAEGIVLKRADS